MDSNRVQVYTDGGCIGNPGIGAWAYILLYDDQKIPGSGYHPNTTNNQMELQAVIEALKHIRQLEEAQRGVVLYSDSRYVIQGITDWLPQWKKRNWKRANNKPVINPALWKELDLLRESMSVLWEWLPGHANIEMNEQCHAMVHETIDHHGHA